MVLITSVAEYAAGYQTVNSVLVLLLIIDNSSSGAVSFFFPSAFSRKGKRFFTPFSIGCFFWAGQWKKILQNEGTMNLKAYFCTSIIGEGGYRLFRSFAGPDSMKDYKLVFTIVKNWSPGCILVIGYRWACGVSLFCIYKLVRTRFVFIQF